MRAILFASISIACLIRLPAASAGYLIDDFSQGLPFDTTYSTALVDSQSGLDPQHALRGQRLARFDSVFGGGTARAALDTAQGLLILDSIQGGDLGGGGLTVQYGEYATGGPAIDFDLTAFADQVIEVTLQSLVAGDSKGPQSGITWRTNIHSRDLVEVTPGNFEVVDHFTNVDVPIANTVIPFTASLPVNALLGGPANPADLVGMRFSFFPLGTEGSIVLSQIEIVPEPSTVALAAFGFATMVAFGRCPRMPSRRRVPVALQWPQ